VHEPKSVRLAGDRCLFGTREKYCWLIAGEWFVLREKYYWLISQPNMATPIPWPIHSARLVSRSGICSTYASSAVPSRTTVIVMNDRPCTYDLQATCRPFSSCQCNAYTSSQLLIAHTVVGSSIAVQHSNRAHKYLYCISPLLASWVDEQQQLMRCSCAS
jgi:hypothetical protein